MVLRRLDNSQCSSQVIQGLIFALRLRDKNKSSEENEASGKGPKRDVGLQCNCIPGPSVNRFGRDLSMSRTPYYIAGDKD
jgi:hypothetical protein